MSNMIINEKGELIKLDKLDEVDIMEIRMTYFHEKVTMKQLANYFHTSISNIYKILNRDTWKNV